MTKDASPVRALAAGLPDEQAVLIYLHYPRPPSLPRRQVRLHRERGLRQPVQTVPAVLFLPLGEGWVAEVLDPWLASWPALLETLWPRLSPEGSLWIQVHPRDGAYLKVLADALLGRRCFRNEVVWVHPPRFLDPRRWPETHQALLGYVKSPRRALFQPDAVDRIPYMAPRLVGEAKARRGKLPTDVWWPGLGTSEDEAARGEGDFGFPSRFWQRLLRAHTRPGDLLLVVGRVNPLVRAARALGRRCRVLSFPR